jgi:hypothetical protein
LFVKNTQLRGYHFLRDYIIDYPIPPPLQIKFYNLEELNHPAAISSTTKNCFRLSIVVGQLPWVDFLNILIVKKSSRHAIDSFGRQIFNRRTTCGEPGNGDSRDQAEAQQYKDRQGQGIELGPGI